jgi:hypothetical protein
MRLACMNREADSADSSSEVQTGAFRTISRDEPKSALRSIQYAKEGTLCWTDRSMANRIFHTAVVRRSRKTLLGNGVWVDESFGALVGCEIDQPGGPRTDWPKFKNVNR